MSGDGLDERSLERALRAPGSPAELTGEAEYLAMFRTARGSGPSAAAPGARPRAGRRAARRFGTSSTLAVVFAVTSAGVAAAYSASLPTPVQRAVHSVLAPLGGPAAEPPRRHVADPPATSPTPRPATPTVSASAPPAPRRMEPAPAARASRTPAMVPADVPESPAPSTSASPDLEGESASPAASEGASATEPTESPSTGPTAQTDPAQEASPTAQPSPTQEASPPAAAAPASVRIFSAGAGQRVAPGGTAVIEGRVLAADGSPVPDVRAVLQAHGSSGWRRLATTRSAADGSISVVSGPISRSTVVRLRVHRVLSAPRPLIVQPTLSLAATTNATSAIIAVTSNGGRSGDEVRVLTRRNGRWVVELRGRLDAAGTVRFQVPAPAGPRTYVVRLAATAAHAAAEGRVTVIPPPPPSPSPSSPPPATAPVSPEATP